ncbi:hypothetical protein like AT2G17972 [Hibiscus trionum]|uniref:Uncharacterized protein n=1 Tax=Hibiscus trionum TaxID=183268 RepID=A0A9W7HZP3_HIBTR|nr:hypothetical protein like AT2G17972 [Hibiscus trionum]
MDSSILQSLASKSPPSTNPLALKPSSLSTTCNHLSFPSRRRRLPRVHCTNSSTDNSSSSEAEPPVPPPVRPPLDTLQIRFKRGSRRRRKLQEEGVQGEGQKMKAKTATPKKWEEMSMAEKAVELYVGEKGLLFWLNKFAYASIFIVIGAWVLFRFVGPALNLYQLDSAPLPPTSMFKAS